MTGRRTQRDSEQGVALVLVAMLMFAVMAMMALTVDIGLVLMTRTQMQTAVDTAALEGLRQRDAGREEPYLVRDTRRRLSASLVARLVYDSDGVITDEFLEQDDTLGAGPVFDITPARIQGAGAGSLGSSQRTGETPTLNSIGVYKPAMQLNLDNERHGDMVQGKFIGDDFPLLRSTEGRRYFRSDFRPVNEIPGSLSDPTSDAFLVRMRRTNDFLGLDNIQGVSSAGPAVSMMFGHGGLVPAGKPNQQYSYRHHGITVRATAIARARPVLTVGPPVQIDAWQRDKVMLGRAPFCLTGKFVKDFRGRGKVRISNSKLKIKTGEGPTGRERKIGWFIPHNLGLGVGDKIRERDLVELRPTTLDITGYVPIVEKFAGERGFPETEGTSDWRVIGFGLFVMKGTIEETPRGVGGKEITLRQYRGQLIMSENASAVTVPSFRDPTANGGYLGAKAVELLLRRNEKLARNGLAVWAPALAR